MPDRRPTPATTQLLRTSHLFDGLSDDMLDRMVREVPTELAEPGQVVIAEGELAAHMFVVLTGEVEVLHKGRGDHSRPPRVADRIPAHPSSQLAHRYVVESRRPPPPA